MSSRKASEAASCGPPEVGVRQQACRGGFTVVSAVRSPVTTYHSLQRDNATTSEWVGYLRRQSPTTSPKT